MLIAISSDSYIHPHRHVGKSESFHIVEGEVDVAVFDEAGDVVDVIELGAMGSGRNFYYRLSESAFHTLLIRTEFLVSPRGHQRAVRSRQDGAGSVRAARRPSRPGARLYEAGFRRGRAASRWLEVMTDGNGFLVVGGDSLVGGGCSGPWSAAATGCSTSTRRRDTLGAQRVYLDFESETPFQAPPGIRYAFLIAAATNYDRCEKDPLAHRINVELIPRLVASLLEQGLFVTFISTNSVFGGERPWPHEDEPHTPGIAYARQKAEGEKVIRAAAQGLTAHGSAQYRAPYEDPGSAHVSPAGLVLRLEAR